MVSGASEPMHINTDHVLIQKMGELRHSQPELAGLVAEQVQSLYDDAIGTKWCPVALFRV
jgi:hypothetical protein